MNALRVGVRSKGKKVGMREMGILHQQEAKNLKGGGEERRDQQNRTQKKKKKKKKKDGKRKERNLKDTQTGRQRKRGRG